MLCIKGEFLKSTAHIIELSNEQNADFNFVFRTQSISRSGSSREIAIEIIAQMRDGSMYLQEAPYRNVAIL